jgi:hypothetical protein
MKVFIHTLSIVQICEIYYYIEFVAVYMHLLNNTSYSCDSSRKSQVRFGILKKSKQQNDS